MKFLLLAEFLRQFSLPFCWISWLKSSLISNFGHSSFFVIEAFKSYNLLLYVSSVSL